MPYTKAALKKFLQEVPHLDAIQFRMHDESGLKNGQEMEDFWTRRLSADEGSGGKIRFEARAKEFPDELIDRALEVGVDLRISTKYWMEQMGLPFHPTHIHPAQPARPPPRLCRHAPLSEAIPDALAVVERRHVARAALGRSRVRAAVCPRAR